ncbi:YceI family protein [Methylophaga sp. OBS4]|uniref:YceI family protein n=1 Tax=Methylophaga sp. OBS4 TaxID=2991935 RepID=UPI00225B1A02|nr:YceI family protein [Methylophaga sp. OBS4]MCX4188586.1 YceI family protein [Methylophaga sp. OBS4]
MKYLQKSSYLLSLLLLSAVAQAGQWLVNNEQSQLSFVSTKKVNIAEVHHFGQLAGGLSESGQFSLDIDLASVDTGIEIRDSRMREFLFNIVEFPKARITAEVDSVVIDALEVAQSTTMTIEGELSLHGQSQPLTSEVLVTRISDSELLVVSAKPIILSVADYELVQGVEKLRELAGLPSISHAVPVSFYLTLNAAN